MKRVICVLLSCMLCGMSLTGCSFFDRTFSSVKVHQEQSASDEDASILRAEDYTDLVSCVQHFVAMGQVSGTVHVYKYPGDLAEDLEKACNEVCTEDPLGAYALNDISYSYNRIVSYYECSFQFDYRRSAEQMAAISTAYGNAAIRDLLCARLSSFSENLAIRTSSYYADVSELYVLAQEAYYSAPETALGYPRITISVYPDSGEVRIVEISIDYSLSAEVLKEQAASVTAAAAELAGRESGATETVAWLLYSRLASRTEYVPDGSASVYDALCAGAADSEGLALAYEVLCSQAGVPCSMVQGTLAGEPHCWNRITLDGTVWNADLTRGDTEETLLHTDSEFSEAGYQWAQEDEAAQRINEAD